MDSNEELMPSTVLHWNYRGFTEFPLNQLQGEEAEVTDIYLKENLLTRLPSNIGVLEHLESLYVSGNDITELPREISKLRCLKCLDVSGNRLRRIPDEIGEARNLKFLILDENELTELPLRIAELRRLRYLSICDNKLQWLPQRPVYNYHHCEFRFWRNSSLKTLPYSLWYHMFRDQQTRCLNIGCLSTGTNPDARISNCQCKLKVKQDSVEWEVVVKCPSQYNVILETSCHSPPSLFEICKRRFYQMMTKAVKKLNPQTYSFYSEHVRENLYNEHNNNITDLQENFQGVSIINSSRENNDCDENGNNCKPTIVKENHSKKFSKSYYVPADIIKEYFNFLPNFLKFELSNGPISRCENLHCKGPVFDYAFCEFCFGEIVLIDKIEEILLSAMFCSKSCADLWKRGKDTIPWTLVSYAALCAEKYRHFKHYPCMIHPYSSLRLFLDTLNVILLLLLGLYLAFYYGVINTRVLNFHTKIICFCDFIFILNIFTNFLTGYIEGHSCKEVVFDLKKIAWNYTKTWLFVDIISSVSFIPYFFHHPYSPTCFILESVKLLRIPCATQYLRNILIVMKASIHQTIAVEILLCIITFLSWNIYFQFSVEYVIEGSFQPVSPRLCSWLTYGKLWNETMSVRMVYALDRAVGMLTSNTNMNIIQRQHCFEVFFAVAWLISKFFVFHFVMKYLMALLGTEAARAKYYIMQKQLKHYMIERKFSPRLKKKIFKFYSIRFQSKYFTESAMVDCVSGQLREDILMHTGRQLVKELDFLKQLPMSVLMQIAFKLRVVIFIAGDIIIKINTIGDCLYFIDKGTVAIYSESGQEICHLEDGDFFGEISLVMGRFRTASAVAVTNCELFRLDKEDFDSTIAYYPIVYDNIKKVARDRFETTCVLDEHHKAELKTDDGSDIRT